MMKSKFSQTATVITVVLGISFFVAGVQRRRPVKHGSVCGDPTTPCQTSVTFQSYDLPFRVPKDAVIYDTELFYAVILKRVPVKSTNCDRFISEAERLRAQKLFAHRKVFTSRRCADTGEVGYENANHTDATSVPGGPSEFMAVYAGPSLSEANRTLAEVKAVGRFPKANVRRIRA